MEALAQTFLEIDLQTMSIHIANITTELNFTTTRSSLKLATVLGKKLSIDYTKFPKELGHPFQMASEPPIEWAIRRLHDDNNMPRPVLGGKYIINREELKLVHYFSFWMMSCIKAIINADSVAQHSAAVELG